MQIRTAGDKSLYQFRADRRKSADYIPQHIQISAEHFQRGTDGAVCPWRQFQKHRRKWSGLVDRRKPDGTYAWKNAAFRGRRFIQSRSRI